MKPENYIADETEQANPVEELYYAELHLGKTTILWHGDSCPEDKPTYQVKTWLRAEVHNTIYKNTDQLTEEQAEQILESYGPWDYAE